MVFSLALRSGGAAPWGPFFQVATDAGPVRKSYLGVTKRLMSASQPIESVAAKSKGYYDNASRANVDDHSRPLSENERNAIANSEAFAKHGFSRPIRRHKVPTPQERQAQLRRHLAHRKTAQVST
jgi:hypothetical protein